MIILIELRHGYGVDSSKHSLTALVIQTEGDFDWSAEIEEVKDEIKEEVVKEESKNKEVKVEELKKEKKVIEDA
ncbi:hypothetical protein L1987_69107 [Smallanthus sonchifolius]|uniref:Uncharacterized protein n=1 Tax=Smallanthus sonchifolius TaxID=185202 RepID=A0ACB9B522_9ASTR|nr:hypothetical protein L1987_69107 [Smallanthus sonchifolius]